MEHIIDPQVFKLDGLSIPDTATPEQWEAIHRTIITCKRAAGKWINQSRSFATAKWGIDYAANAEIQMELALGIESKGKEDAINAPNKSKAIVTIEGIAQSFKLWARSLGDDIDRWDTERCKRALVLLEPMESQARRLRNRLESQ
jgi:hypothetical protein